MRWIFGERFEGARERGDEMEIRAGGSEGLRRRVFRRRAGSI